MKENDMGANAEKIEKIYKKDLRPFREKKEKKPFSLHDRTK